MSQKQEICNIGKMMPIDLLNGSLPQAFNLLKKKKKKVSVEHNNTRYACKRREGFTLRLN